MKNCLLLLGVLAIPALPVFAQETTPVPTPTPRPEEAPAKRRRGFRPGIELGFFRFNSSATGDTFGGNGISISPAFGAIRSATRRGTIRPDFSFNLSRSNGNTLAFLPIGARYILGLSDKENQPYIGASLDIAPAYTRIKTLSQGGKFELAGGGSVFAGYNFGDRFNLEARYFQLSKVRGFDLSHFEVAAGARF